MNQHQASSSLLSLPAELRLQIYSYIVTTDNGQFTLVDTECYYDPRSNFWTIFHENMREQIPRLQKQQAARHLAFLSTCRQIHSEARLLPFRCNDFVFNSDRFFRVMNSVAEDQWSAITTVTIQLSVDYYHREPKLGVQPLYRTRIIQVLARLPELKKLDIEIMAEDRITEKGKWEGTTVLRVAMRKLKPWVRDLMGNGVVCMFWGSARGERREIWD